MINTVKITKLDNGLTIATDSMADASSVSLGVYVNTGTRQEQKHQHGIAHLLEHMAFKGTLHRSAREIAIAMDAIGGHLNAYTTRETTAYHTKVLPKDVALSLEILGDILQFSVFLEDEIDKEKAVVLQEIGQTIDTPDDYVFDLFQETAYPHQSMGWSILGTVDSVNNLKRNDIIDYLNTHYITENIIIVAAGKITHDELLSLVQQHFRNFANAKSLPLQKARYQGGNLYLPKALEQCHFVMGFEGVPSASDDFYKIALYSTLLGGGMSSRLFQTIREKYGLVYSIYSFSSSYEDTGVFGIYAGTGSQEAKKLIPLLTQELLLSTMTITHEELERSKDQLKATILMARESTNARVEQLAQNILVFGRPLSTEEVIDSIDKVTIAEIMSLAREIIQKPLTVTALGAIDHLDSYEKIQERLKL